jgi:hypothetical protein
MRLEIPLQMRQIPSVELHSESLSRKERGIGSVPVKIHIDSRHGNPIASATHVGADAFVRPAKRSEPPVRESPAAKSTPDECVRGYTSRVRKPIDPRPSPVINCFSLAVSAPESATHLGRAEVKYEVLFLHSAALPSDSHSVCQRSGSCPARGHTFEMHSR